MNAALFNFLRRQFVLLLLVVSLNASPTLHAVTQKILYTFRGVKNGDRGWPEAGLAFDAHGSLYGTTSYWGGNVFQLAPNGDGTWTHTTLTEFHKNKHDGAYPLAGVVFDAYGNLYGTTSYGGQANSWGTVYQLIPNGTERWTERILATHFQLGDSYPAAELTMDEFGRLFGTTNGNPVFGGLGSVFEVIPYADKKPTTHVPYNFQFDPDGNHPSTPLAIDAAHNLFGMTQLGGTLGGGTIFELSPVGGGEWVEKTIYNFPLLLGGTEGGLTFDKAGNVFGTAQGTIFELIPAGDDWTFKTLYTFTDGSGRLSRLTIDDGGNLYGTARIGGIGECANDYGCGSIFELSPTKDGWQSTTIYQFTGGDDGGNPVGGIIFDASGNMYGLTNLGGINGACGSFGCGVAYEVTP